MSKLSSAIIALALPALLGAQGTLDKSENQLRSEIAKRQEDQISYLETLVDIPSGSLNVQGVRDVGNVVMAVTLPQRVREPAGAEPPDRARCRDAVPTWEAAGGGLPAQAVHVTR